MATPSPSGSAMSIATKLTSRVPSISGSTPNCGAGVAVGIHWRPPKKSAGVMRSLRSILTPAIPSGTYWSGMKATIPGVEAMTSPSRWGNSS